MNYENTNILHNHDEKNGKTIVKMNKINEEDYKLIKGICDGERLYVIDISKKRFYSKLKRFSFLKKKFNCDGQMLLENIKKCDIKTHAKSGGTWSPEDINKLFEEHKLIPCKKENKDHYKKLFPNRSFDSLMIKIRREKPQREHKKDISSSNDENDEFKKAS